MKKLACLPIPIAIFLLSSIADAADKVVVVPLNTNQTSAVKTVISGGRVWIDRNLGADRVAGSKSDMGAYGNYYQWGRCSDGHDYSTSPMTTSSSDGDVPGHGSFIYSHINWRTTRNDTLWQGGSGVNNPCPPGYRIPTISEWIHEAATWSSENADGAFASQLKLPLSGYRNWNNGEMSGVGTTACYWSSTVADDERAQSFSISSTSAEPYNDLRAYGCNVRCIRN